VGTIVRYQSFVYRVIGTDTGGNRGGRLLIQRRDERGVKLGKVVLAADVVAVTPRASTSGEAPRRRHHRHDPLDLKDQRPATHAKAAHRQGRQARKGHRG
jgi:hypothetical protein